MAPPSVDCCLNEPRSTTVAPRPTPRQGRGGAEGLVGDAGELQVADGHAAGDGVRQGLDENVTGVRLNVGSFWATLCLCLGVARPHGLAAGVRPVAIRRDRRAGQGTEVTRRSTAVVDSAGFMLKLLQFAPSKHPSEASVRIPLGTLK